MFCHVRDPSNYNVFIINHSTADISRKQVLPDISWRSPSLGTRPARLREDLAFEGGLLKSDRPGALPSILADPCRDIRDGGRNEVDTSIANEPGCMNSCAAASCPPSAFADRACEAWRVMASCMERLRAESRAPAPKP